MVQVGNEKQDSYGDINHKLDYRIGNREHGQLVQIDRANEALAVTITGALPTYSAAFSFAAVSGDAVVIFGSVLHNIRVQEIVIAKPSAIETVLIVQRSTLDTGGTSTLAVNGLVDPDDPITSTAVRLYTAAPTLGTSAGTIARAVVNISDLMVFSFKDWPKPPTLRNSTDCLAVNVDASATLPGWIVWTEEAR